jgi:hypothetical protein
MRFMIMFKADSDTEAAAPACMVLPEMGRFIEELREEGVLLATEGLKPSGSQRRACPALRGEGHRDRRSLH